MVGVLGQYWREISLLCLASALFLNWVLLFMKRKLFNKKRKSSLRRDSTSSLKLDSQDSGLEEIPSPFMSLDSTSSDNINNNNYNHNNNNIKKCNNNLINININNAISTICTSNSKRSDILSSKSSLISDHSTCRMRNRSSTLCAKPIDIPKVNNSRHLQHQSHSQPNSLSTSLNTPEHNSRYVSDFDSLRRLGHGGFGVVFEARNKIDDCHYAVKRICLPLEKDARDRVMREVRALAKLDHTGIVRYYNAWLETPPEEWLKEHDAKLGIIHSKDGLSFASTDGLYDKNGYDRYSTRRENTNSKDLFRQNSLLKTQASSCSLDIVFEGSGSIRIEQSSDSDDNDFIQFKPVNKQNTNHQQRHHNNRSDDIDDCEGSDDDESSFSSISAVKVEDLSDPFSSSSEGACEDCKIKVNGKTKNISKYASELRKENAFKIEKNVQRLASSIVSENLQTENIYLYIQMQLCRKDTLKDWLRTNSDDRDKIMIFDLFYQIVDAVEYVHSQDMIHRDLKPSNIFFSMDGIVKIGDFGLVTAKSTSLGSSIDLQEYVAESYAEKCFEAVHTKQVGTQLYMSPEQLNGISYNHKVDIFAMGLILLELLIPFKTQMQRVSVLFKARNNLFSDDFKREHPQEHELVKSLLIRNPQKRPTASEIKQHDLLSNAQLSPPVIDRINSRRRTISSNSSNSQNSK